MRQPVPSIACGGGSLAFTTFPLDLFRYRWVLGDSARYGP